MFFSLPWEIPTLSPFYWDRILINASQVTNPPIDPLREPMETRVYLGKKPEQVHRLADGTINCTLPPQLELAMPVMFSAMSYGSISYNAHKSLALADNRDLELFMILPEKEGFTRIFIVMEKTPLSRLHPDVLAYMKNI